MRTPIRLSQLSYLTLIRNPRSYISYRQSYAHHPNQRSKYASGGFSDAYSTSSFAPEDRRGLLSSGAFEDDGDAVIEMDLLPPRWTDVSDEITELLAEIATKSQRLDKLHQTHVLPGFDDDEAKKREEVQIERLTQEITKSFHQCHQRIQKIEHMVRESTQSGTISRAEETMGKNIQISLATRVQEASANFRKKQSAYLKSQPRQNPPDLDTVPPDLDIVPPDLDTVPPDLTCITLTSCTL